MLQKAAERPARLLPTSQAPTATDRGKRARVGVFPGHFLTTVGRFILETRFIPAAQEESDSTLRNGGWGGE